MKLGNKIFKARFVNFFLISQAFRLILRLCHLTRLIRSWTTKYAHNREFYILFDLLFAPRLSKQCKVLKKALPSSQFSEILTRCSLEILFLLKILLFGVSIFSTASFNGLTSSFLTSLKLIAQMVLRYTERCYRHFAILHAKLWIWRLKCHAKIRV